MKIKQSGAESRLATFLSSAAVTWHEIKTRLKMENPNSKIKEEKNIFYFKKGIHIMRRIKKLLSLVLVSAFVLMLIPGGMFSSPVLAAEPDTGIMRDITTMQLVYDMGLGINLGNTLDTTGDWINPESISNYETAWGSPIITEDMIKAYADAGFRTMRIPVTWSNMMLPDYTINPELMDRVQQIVDWVIGNGMYAIVNLHHDSFIADLFPTNEAEGFKKYEAIWSQVSERFKDYSDYLMFESMNEPGFDAIWNQYTGTQEQKERAFDLINRVNQRFVDVVRASGGNNAERHLLISTYFTNIGHANNGLTQMPNDPAGRCAISVHYYTPWTWVGLNHDETWGNARWEWGTPVDYAEMNTDLDLMKTNYVDKGIPVIVGEFCMCSTKPKQYSDLWEIEVARGIYERGMCPVFWDVQGSVTNFFNRNTLTWGNPEVLSAMQEISATRDFTKVYDNWIAVSKPIETINYGLAITNMPENPSLTFENQNSNWSDGRQLISSWENGSYSLTYTYSGTGVTGLKNLGWVHNIAGSPITMRLDKLTVTYGSDASASTAEFTPIRTLEVGTDANALPNIWSGIGVGQKLFESADGTSWLAYDGNANGGTDNICLYVDGTKTNMSSIKYDFTIAGGIEVKDIDLTITVDSLNPTVKYNTPFKAVNGAYNYNVDFGTMVAGIENLGYVDASIADTDITLDVNKLIVNGKYYLKPTQKYVMETKSGGAALPNIENATEGEKLFESFNGAAYLAMEGGIIKLFVMVPGYTVTFDSDGGSEVEAAIVAQGETVAKPADPSKDGYRFDGWYLGENAFGFDTEIMGNITLTAIWKYAGAFATIEKLNGNQNELTITITEYFSNGSSEAADYTILIDNNAAGVYEIGGYKVFVDTKGNTQVREIYIVEE